MLHLKILKTDLHPDTKNRALFDYVLIEEKIKIPYNEFNKLSLQARCKIVMNKKVKFIYNDKSIATKDALGNNIKNLT